MRSWCRRRFRHGLSVFSPIGGDVVMVGVIVAVCILSMLFLVMAATVFCELPRNARDVFCFLVMLVAIVAVVLVSVVKEF